MSTGRRQMRENDHRRFRLAGGRRQEDNRRNGMPWWRVAAEREAGEPAERQSYEQHPPRNPRGS
jgi:hypothetical protein